MTHYENERTLPVYTTPFAKRRVVYEALPRQVNDYLDCACTICQTVRHLKGEGERMQWNEVHGILYRFKRRYLDYSQEESLDTTLASNLQYWAFVAEQLKQLK